MRILLTGKDGQLGFELRRALAPLGEVVAVGRADCDLADADALRALVRRVAPDVIVNPAAYTAVDQAESAPAAASAVNARAPGVLGEEGARLGALVVHYSTDYVFDGAARHPYIEEDLPHPLGAYAVSKLAGEMYAQAYLNRALVVRTSGVFGPGGMATARGNFVELMLRLAASPNPIRVVEDHVASPTYAPLLAARTIDLVERGLSGVFHVGGGAPISWFEWARMIFRRAGANPRLQAVTERSYRTPARRPKYSALSNSKMEACGLEPMPALDWALDRYFQQRLAGSVPA